MKVPKTKIPKVVPVCTVCRGPCRTIVGVPFADGYHRRHRCRNILCDYAFYTLSDYTSDKVEVSPLPFKDRPLTEYDEAVRMSWWEDEAWLVEVTTRGNSMPIIDRLVLALAKKEEDRDAVEAYMVEAFAKIETVIKQHEDTRNE